MDINELTILGPTITEGHNGFVVEDSHGRIFKVLADDKRLPR